MKRLLRILAAALLTVSAGCAQQKTAEFTATPELSASPAPTASAAAVLSASPGATDAGEPEEGLSSEALLRMLPETPGFQWTYDGSMETGHALELMTVTRSGDTRKFAVTGAVRDSPGMAGEGDRQIHITYTLEPGVWIQEKNASAMLESKFDRLEILRAPLAVGETWEQTPASAGGGPITLRCTLESLTESEGGTICVVRYEDGRGYYERREITAGVGVTAFERSSGNGGDPVGYWLLGAEAPVRGVSVSEWLPPLGRTLHFTGPGEEGHATRLIMESDGDRETVYRLEGKFDAQGGAAETFLVRYYYDKNRGTLTEKAVGNDRTGQAEFYSILHNVVVLRFPLAGDARWEHDTMIGGERRLLTAEVIRCDTDAGIAVVRYAVEGVPGYPDNTYIEERTFELGLGMVDFRQRLPLSDEPTPPVPMQAGMTLTPAMTGYRLDSASAEP